MGEDGAGGAPTELPLNQGAWLLPVAMTLTLCSEGPDAEVVRRSDGQAVLASLLCPLSLTLSRLLSEPCVLASPDTGPHSS